MNGQTCGGCKHGCATSADLREPIECRRFPPTFTSFVVPGPQGLQVADRTAYPRVARLAAGCGEFTPKMQGIN